MRVITQLLLVLHVLSRFDLATAADLAEKTVFSGLSQANVIGAVQLRRSIVAPSSSNGINISTSGLLTLTTDGRNNDGDSSTTGSGSTSSSESDDSTSTPGTTTSDSDSETTTTIPSTTTTTTSPSTTTDPTTTTTTTTTTTSPSSTTTTTTTSATTTTTTTSPSTTITTTLSTPLTSPTSLLPIMTTATLSTTSSMIPSFTPTETPIQTSTPSSGTIAGAVVGAVAGAALIGGLAFLFLRRRKRSQNPKEGGVDDTMFEDDLRTHTASSPAVSHGNIMPFDYSRHLVPPTDTGYYYHDSPRHEVPTEGFYPYSPAAAAAALAAGAGEEYYSQRSSETPAGVADLGDWTGSHNNLSSHPSTSALYATAASGEEDGHRLQLKPDLADEDHKPNEV